MAFELGTIPRWAFTNQFGILNAGGKLHFYRSVAKDQNKTVYHDENGIVPYTDPITLDAVGSVGLIYFNDDEPYYITLYDSTDTQLIWDVDNYSPAGGGGGGGGLTEIDYTNFVINGQFRFFNKLIFDSLLASELEIAAYWYFDKSNLTATDTLRFLTFPLGVTAPPFSPTYYLRYNCTNVPTGETYKDIYIKIKDVNVFQDQQITISIEQQGTNPAQLIEFRYRQHFGTGGTPSADVEGAIAAHNVNASWGKISSTTTLPSIGGKTLGTNSDDYLGLIIRLPLDVTTQVDITNFQVNIGDKVLDYEFQTYDKAHNEARSILLPYDNYISGLYTTRHIDHIDISAGACTDKLNHDLFKVPAITKYIDSTWADGAGNGGMASGVSLTQDTWYHLFIIMVPHGGVDAGFDTDINATNLLADAAVQAKGYLYYRRIFSFRTETTSIVIRSYGQRYETVTYYHDFKGDSISDTDNSLSGNLTLDVPTGISVEAICNVYGSSDDYPHVINFTALSPTFYGSPPAAVCGSTSKFDGTNVFRSYYQGHLLTTTSGTVYGHLKLNSPNFRDLYLSMTANGYRDYRLD